jgi:hypothetical protein
MATKVPFYGNFDNSHCLQCTLRGVVEYFEPHAPQLDWPAWDAFTGKEPDKWTWPYRGVLNMVARGYEVITYSSVSLDAYVNDGIYPTMVKNLGQAAADKQREMADLDKVYADLKKYIACIKAGQIVRHEKLPTLSIMQRLLAQGYLVHSSLNWRKLYNKPGYASHAVLVYKMTPHFVFFHDSGQPPRPATRVGHARFVAASTDPTPKAWGLTAYRLRKN